MAPAAFDGVSSVEQLLARFDGAWAGDHDHLGPSNRDSVDVHDRALGLDLPAHQLKRLSDRHYVVDAGSNLQRLDFVAASAADCGYDRPLGAARNVRLVASLADTVDHVRNFLFGGFLGHVDDHGKLSSLKSPLKNKNRDPQIAAANFRL